MSKTELLEQIDKAIRSCRQCRLYRTRTSTVPGEGDPNAKIAFVGEAPGYNEDRQGRPFVGRAGELLDELLRSIGLSRGEVWIGNIIKCRPPDNRDPMVDEVRACKPYLEEQLRAIKPKLVVPLGRVAAAQFLKEARISKARGTPKRVGNFIVYPVFHPAAALRSVSVLRILKEDFLRIPEILKMKPDEVEAEVFSKVAENQMSLL